MQRGVDGFTSVESSFVNGNLANQNRQKEKSPTKKKFIEDEEDDICIKRQVLSAMPPMELTNIRRNYSLKPDMVFGWQPNDIHGAPIPLRFDFDVVELPINPNTQDEYPIYYIGKRYTDSLTMHR